MLLQFDSDSVLTLCKMAETFSPSVPLLLVCRHGGCYLAVNAPGSSRVYPDQYPGPKDEHLPANWRVEVPVNAGLVAALEDSPVLQYEADWCEDGVDLHQF